MELIYKKMSYYINMKRRNFINILKEKINKYDKFSSNPFGSMPLSITLVWIEDEQRSEKFFQTLNDKKRYF